MAYTLIAETSTRLSAATVAWESAYQGMGVDYARWLLSQVDKVTIDDVVHALKRYVVPLFDPSANLAASCPTNKLDDVCVGLEGILGHPVLKLREEELPSLFGTEHT